MTTMPSSRLPHVAACLLGALLLVLTVRGYDTTTVLLVASSLAMFGICWASAQRVLGAGAALRLVAIGLACGWLAEELGASYGWFFGRYHYTAVLGPRLGAVPAVIPLMWFALSYAGYTIANLIVWQAPGDGPAPWRHDLLMALLGAMVVTCYDLGVDPYMVYVLKAWIMQDTHGAWFGETVQGFAGWMTVAFAILLGFRRTARRSADPVRGQGAAAGTGAVLVPLGVYAGLMVFQVLLGYPVEARTIALFAMGFPLLAATCGLLRWRGWLARPGLPNDAPAAAEAPRPIKKAA